MIKVFVKPNITQQETKWGLGIPKTNYVNYSVFYIEETLFKKIQIHQAKINKTLPEEQIKVEMQERFLKTGFTSQVLEFNGLVGYLDDDTSEYVRQYALLGEPRIFKHHIGWDIYAQILKIMAWFKNL